MMNRHTPPGLTSISWIVFVNPFGPHHCATCLGSVNALKTSSRGASKTRARTISRSAVAAPPLFFTAMHLLLLLKFLQVSVEAIEALLPEAAIALDPVGDILERLRR